MFQCNLEHLNLWKADASNLSGDAQLGIAVFNAIDKGVDALHIKNHVRDECRQNYPAVIEKLRSTFLKPNTESAEQTFVWLGKFKKILSSMDKRHHLFFFIAL